MSAKVTRRAPRTQEEHQGHQPPQRPQGPAPRTPAPAAVPRTKHQVPAPRTKHQVPAQGHQPPHHRSSATGGPQRERPRRGRGDLSADSGTDIGSPLSLDCTGPLGDSNHGPTSTLQSTPQSIAQSISSQFPSQSPVDHPVNPSVNPPVKGPHQQKDNIPLCIAEARLCIAEVRLQRHCQDCRGIPRCSIPASSIPGFLDFLRDATTGRCKRPLVDNESTRIGEKSYWGLCR